jgi:hypothetical protein
MQTLDPEENLIAHVARATCFAYRFESGEVPASDVDRYVDELIALFRRKPDAPLIDSDDQPATVAATLEFCADQLQEVAPEHASRLRAVLESAR